MYKILFLIIVTSGSWSELQGQSQDTAEDVLWYRGNIHTHSYWNGGRDFPENIAKWYKENGYNFVAFTEHNTLQIGDHWVQLPENNSAIDRYRSIFGDSWVEIIPDQSKPGFVKVRTKPLEEYKSMFEKSNEFLLINGTEITDSHSVHFLVHNVDELISTVGGAKDERPIMMDKIVNKVIQYQDRTQRNTQAILAHPNWNWSLTAEMINMVPNLQLFEVFNGVPESNNTGDIDHVSTDEIWDIVLADRLSKKNKKLLYGVATDDAHDYDGGKDGRNVGPGKGWIMVRCDTLSPKSILGAIEKGDFYSSTGVVLKDIQFDGRTLTIEIDPKNDEDYTVEYIGTKKDYDPSSHPAIDSLGNIRSNTTRVYSDDIGEVFKGTDQILSSYSLTGDELYVRARIVSTANQIDPFTQEIIGIQKAWVQLIIPKTLNQNN